MPPKRREGATHSERFDTLERGGASSRESFAVTRAREETVTARLAVLSPAPSAR